MRQVGGKGWSHGLAYKTLCLTSNVQGCWSSYAFQSEEHHNNALYMEFISFLVYMELKKLKMFKINCQHQSLKTTLLSNLT